ncbi:MAG TPA: UbiX family flavin prenyltransferase [Methanospirillum sp.]|nr:UbiX family flavin prenyltransferase [Methanospirillum sp.]
MRRKIVVGVTGASGMIYASRLLHHLTPLAQVHLIISPVAREIAAHEGVSFDNLEVTTHRFDDLAAPIASGSFRHDGMVIVPCSMKTLASVASGITPNLVARAADVALKERRPCLLLLRENPLSRIHLTNMLTAHDAGATIMVASPPFYHQPTSMEELADAVIARILDHLQVEHDISGRWSGY